MANDTVQTFAGFKRFLQQKTKVNYQGVSPFSIMKQPDVPLRPKAGVCSSKAAEVSHGLTLNLTAIGFQPSSHPCHMHNAEEHYRSPLTVLLYRDGLSSLKFWFPTLIE